MSVKQAITSGNEPEISREPGNFFWSKYMESWMNTRIIRTTELTGFTLHYSKKEWNGNPV